MILTATPFYKSFMIPKLQEFSLGGIEYMKNGAVCQGKKTTEGEP
jgi:hypothetical protein